MSTAHLNPDGVLVSCVCTGPSFSLSLSLFIALFLSVECLSFIPTLTSPVPPVGMSTPSCSTCVAGSWCLCACATPSCCASGSREFHGSVCVFTVPAFTFQQNRVRDNHKISGADPHRKTRRSWGSYSTTRNAPLNNSH